MIKNKKGRPQKVNKGRNIIYEALQSLPQDGSPIRFKDLRKKVDMSSATLSKALFYLYSIGQVNKFQVHSQRGKGIIYQKAPDIPVSHENWIKNARELLIKHKTENETSQTILKDFEFIHASELCLQVGVITQAIFDALKCYADSNKTKKDAVLETHLYLINGLIKELSKKLIDEPLGMSNFTHNICFRACPHLRNDLDYVLESAAEVMDWQEYGLNQYHRELRLESHRELRNYLREYPANKLKELLQGKRLEIEKLKQDKECMKDYTDKDEPGYIDYINGLDEHIKYYEQFEPRQKEV